MTIIINPICPSLKLAIQAAILLVFVSRSFMRWYYSAFGRKETKPENIVGKVATILVIVCEVLLLTAAGTFSMLFGKE